MRKLLPFLISLMLVLTGWTGVAYAVESSACLDAPQAQTPMHVADDCDEAPADTGKGCPHPHAACHGHCATAPAESAMALAPIVGRAGFGSCSTPHRLVYKSDPAPRPPQT